MKIFLDTSNIAEIKKWLVYGVIDGVTTNPSVMLKDGHKDVERTAREIALLIAPYPVSIEVCTNDLTEMIKEGRRLAAIESNIVIKIPIINEDGLPCLGVIRTLALAGIGVNVTACMSFNQVMLATKAGATYISLFAGRISDDGNDAVRVIERARRWRDRWNYKSKIIVGSIREAINIQDAAIAGADIITIPPQLMDRMIDHKNTRYTVGEFNRDGEKWQ